ncbi:unnamed protein product [Urochloa humidicola]
MAMAPFKKMNTSADTVAAICIALIMIMSCALSSSGLEEAETCFPVQRCRGERGQIACRGICGHEVRQPRYRFYNGFCYTHVTPYECCCTFYFPPPTDAMA